MTVAQAWPDHRRVVVLTADALPSREATAVLRGAVVELTARDGDLPAQARMVRFLRDATALGVAVRWSVGLLAGIADLSALVHLVPPVIDQAVERAADIIDDWHAEFRYGAFYLRRGPGFISVKDARFTREVHRYTLDETYAAVLFAVGDGIVALDDLRREHDPTVLSELLESEVLYAIGDQVLALPYRVSVWPIPYTAI